MILYHFTSDRAAERIRTSGELRPDLHNVLCRELLWLTSEPNPKASWLFGTASPKYRRFQVDRLAQRFEVKTDEAVPWANIRMEFSEWERNQLELSKGARPELWWVTSSTIRL